MTALIAYSNLWVPVFVNFLGIYFGSRILFSIEVAWYWALALSFVLLLVEILLFGFLKNLGLPPLHRAASAGRIGRLQRLISKGFDLDQFDSDGETALSHAARNGRAEAVKVLLIAGAQPNLCRREGNNFHAPLHYACGYAKSLPIVELLIQHGADVNIRGAWGGTPLSWALSNFELIVLLLDKGADVNTQDDRGRTLLYEQDCFDVALAKLLIARGADVNCRACLPVPICGIC